MKFPTAGSDALSVMKVFLFCFILFSVAIIISCSL